MERRLERPGKEVRKSERAKWKQMGTEEQRAP